MPRGYRCIVVAVVGWLILAAGPAPDNGAIRDQHNAAADVDSSLNAIAAAQTKIADNADPGEYQRPCKATEHNNKSDLCAQWHAARAARDAADWAWWGIFVGAISSIGLFVTLVFNYLAWRQGREGREDTRHAIREARRSNLISIVSEKRARRESRDAADDTKAALLIARRNAKAAGQLARSAKLSLKHSEEVTANELRPWVSFKVISHFKSAIVGNQIWFWFNVEVANFGKFPAVGIRINSFGFPMNHIGRIFILGEAREAFDAALNAAENPGDVGNVLAPNEKIIMVHPMQVDLAMWQNAAAIVPGAGVVVTGELRVDYSWKGERAFLSRVVTVEKADPTPEADDGHTPFDQDAAIASGQPVWFSDSGGGRVG